ncbi:hypothetical protein [Paenibacillus flagellatus]|uniref:Uncharacterized protein n=1 Tax=Paenibacillus flagellatus TaxID=2211139 RepID=A0A2V5KGQ1_9BACL|nr:hypothetical protein [Paenibacillus flagellatus]PYI53390.1 hypothetical protein DLM86_16550 [Paenibacillus flagellatus]
MKMLLIDGISGFPINELQRVDSLQFKKLSYSLVNVAQGRLLSFEAPCASNNFYKAELGWKDERVFLLLNASYPILAFASSIEYFNIKFIDHSLSNDVESSGCGFRVASASELNENLALDERTLTVLNKNSLNQSELSQIFFWKPKTIGDVVFNFWD